MHLLMRRILSSAWLDHSSGFTGVTVDQACRLGAVDFDGSTDSMVALS